MPCLVDEIAEPRPDMNIKVTPLKESKIFYYTLASNEAPDKTFHQGVHCLLLKRISDKVKMLYLETITRSSSIFIQRTIPAQLYKPE